LQAADGAGQVTSDQARDVQAAGAGVHQSIVGAALIEQRQKPFHRDKRRTNAIAW